MTDLEKYIKKRKKRDIEFAEDLTKNMRSLR
jgi:hypothetical protein